MKKDWKYILYLSLAFGLFVAVKLLAPKQYNWSITYSHEDKNPYGAYALHTLLPTIFPEKDINHSYQTLYEIKDSLKRAGNLLIVTANFSPGKEDVDALLKHLEKGGSAFISSQYFWGHFSDTVNAHTSDYLFQENNVFTRKDTATLQFTTPATDTTKRYHYRRDNIHNYFSSFDSTRATVIARNDRGNAITIRIPWGKGHLILNSTPLAFTNIYLLAQQNHEFVSTSLSYLPHAPIEWTEYYHLGRMEASTPLRFILTNEPLAWAYYIAIVTLLLFMIFEMKRKQRIIPIIKPLSNTTLEFVSTIGNLYYQNKEHKSIADKKIAFFLDHVRTKYWLSTSKLDADFMQSLSRKSGRDATEVQSLLKTITNIQGKHQITAAELTELNRKIENFNLNQ